MLLADGVQKTLVTCQALDSVGKESWTGLCFHIPLPPKVRNSFMLLITASSWYPFQRIYLVLKYQKNLSLKPLIVFELAPFFTPYSGLDC